MSSTAHQIVQRKAEVATVVTGGSFGMKFLEVATPWLQFAALTVSCISGVLAIVWWLRRLKIQERQRQKDEEK